LLPIIAIPSKKHTRFQNNVQVYIFVNTTLFFSKNQNSKYNEKTLQLTPKAADADTLTTKSVNLIYKHVMCKLFKLNFGDDGVHQNEKAWALVWEEFLNQTKKVRHDCTLKLLLK